MLLVVDCGNTNVVFAVRDGAAWRGIWRVRTDPQRTSDEYGVWLMSLFDHVGLKRDDLSAAVIGTVVPAALYNLRRLCRDWFSIEPLVARSSLDWGFDKCADAVAQNRDIFLRHFLCFDGFVNHDGDGLRPEHPVAGAVMLERADEADGHDWNSELLRDAEAAVLKRVEMAVAGAHRFRKNNEARAAVDRVLSHAPHAL